MCPTSCTATRSPRRMTTPGTSAGENPLCAPGSSRENPTTPSRLRSVDQPNA